MNHLTKTFVSSLLLLLALPAWADVQNKTMDIYGGARHSFTVPDAERKGIDNLKYDPRADRRSWQRLLSFLDEVLH